MTAKDFCDKVRYRSMKGGFENRFEKGKETWQ